MNEVPQK